MISLIIIKNLQLFNQKLNNEMIKKFIEHFKESKMNCKLFVLLLYSKQSSFTHVFSFI